MRWCLIGVLVAVGCGGGKAKASEADEDYLSRRKVAVSNLAMGYENIDSAEAPMVAGAHAVRLGVAVEAASADLRVGPEASKLSQCATDTTAAVAALMERTEPLRGLAARLNGSEMGAAMDVGDQGYAIWQSISDSVRSRVCALYAVAAECDRAATDIGATMGAKMKPPPALRCP